MAGVMMKAEIIIDIEQLRADITQDIIKALKPLLSEGRGDDDKLFTVKSLADYLSVSPQWIYERIQLKGIPHAKIGTFPRFKKSDIDRWLATMKVPAIETPSGFLKRIK
jgi:excisionase family DNA binding protein